MIKRISSVLILAFAVATAAGGAYAAPSQQTRQPVLAGSNTGNANPAADGTWWKDN